LQDVVVVWGKEPVDKAIEMVVINASIEMSDNQRGHADTSEERRSSSFFGGRGTL